MIIPVMSFRVYVFQALGVALGLGLTSACSEDSPADERPKVTAIPGGGVAGPRLGTALQVFVNDAEGGAPIAGATIELGSGSGPSAKTDAGGSARLPVPLARPLRVRVSAAGYVPATWQGTEGAALSVPLTRAGYRAPYATVSGDLAGWESLAPSAPGRYLVAQIAHSLRPDLEAPDTRVPSDPSEITECTKTSGGGACSFSLRVPASRHALVALVAEADDRGTPLDVLDDRLEMVSFGMATRLNLEAGGRVDGVHLGLADPQTLVQVAIAPAPAPDVSQEVVGVPGFNAAGDVVLFSDFGGRLDRFLVPSKESGIGDGKLWTVGTFASNAGQSRSFVRGIGLPEASAGELRLSTGAFLPLPSLSANAAGITVTSTAPLLEFRVYAAEELVEEGVLLPAAGPESLPLTRAPGQRVEVVAYAGAVDGAEFSLTTLRETAPSIARSSMAVE